MIDIRAVQGHTIALGRLGENNYTRILFDVSEWLAEYPQATIGLLNVRPGETIAYPVSPGNLSLDNGILYWIITSADLSVKGTGRCELVAFQGNTIMKSVIYKTMCLEALDEGATPPEPWESWQSFFQALADNAAQSASDAEAAVEHYPRITDGVWEVWDAQTGAFVSTGVQALGVDGVSPTITVATITGGHRITITDANGTHTVDILDGAKGDTGRGILSVQKTGTAGLVDTYTITYTNSTTSTFTVTNGQNGNPGADGTTFTPAVSAEGVISWTNDGGKTNPQPVNIKGLQGDDGTSPTVSVADITGGHRVTVTDANGTRSFDVMDGEDYVLTAADKAEIAQKAAEDVDVPVQDVQVDGTSVVSDGVAYIPIANSSGTVALGLVKPMAGLGTAIASNGGLAVVCASTNQVKSGTNEYAPIVPIRQHMATFYGLAKAAGADMASSSNPVGMYTDAAKIAIQKMLGIYEAPWELIRDDTVTNATEADIEITVDGNGNPFELTDAIIQLIMDDANTPSSNGGNGEINFIYGAGSNDYKRFFIGSMNHSAGATAIATMARITTTGGLLYGDFALAGGVSGSNNLKFQQYYCLTGNRQMLELVDLPIFFNQIIVKTITGPVRYVLYGKRKWQ